MTGVQTCALPIFVHDASELDAALEKGLKASPIQLGEAFLWAYNTVASNQ